MPICSVGLNVDSGPLGCRTERQIHALLFALDDDQVIAAIAIDQSGDDLIGQGITLPIPAARNDYPYDDFAPIFKTENSPLGSWSRV